MDIIQAEVDYADSLEPGYRFCPTDSELIVYYLKAMIETGQHPACRLHQVNLYDHDPQELAVRYRACDDKWYFLTPRERKHPLGKRPNRRTGNFGYWKTTQKDSAVYHDVTKQVVGKKRSLAYHDGNDKKTPWLMHEYTLIDPDLPVGSLGNKLTDWVICKIYKKERSGNNNQGLVVENPIRNVEDEDESSPMRRRMLVNPEINETEQVAQIQESNHVEAATNVQMLRRFTNNSSYESGDTTRQSTYGMNSNESQRLWVNNLQQGNININRYNNHDVVRVGAISSSMNPINMAMNAQPTPVIHASADTSNIPTSSQHINQSLLDQSKSMDMVVPTTDDPFFDDIDLDVDGLIDFSNIFCLEELLG